MTISSLHSQVRTKKLFIVFTWLTRIMLSLAFIPSGLKKVMGLRFTSIGIDNPVGFFFEALYQTGFYWNFLGIVQLLAAVFIVIPRTSFLGALVYFPIAVNIFVIVTAMGFKGTPLVALFMLLGNLYLFFWEYQKTQMLCKAIAVNSRTNC